MRLFDRPITDNSLYILDINGTTIDPNYSEDDYQFISSKLREIREKGGDYFFATCSSIIDLSFVKSSLDVVQSTTSLQSVLFRDSDEFKSNILFAKDDNKPAAIESFISARRDALICISKIVFYDDNTTTRMIIKRKFPEWEVLDPNEEQSSRA